MVKANRPAPAPQNLGDAPNMEASNAASGDAAKEIGIGVIADFVKRAPPKPGVYRMMAQDGTTLYVGKAKNLKNRITTYARGIGHTNGVTRMLNLVASMDVVITRNEAEALLLEANMIKSARPRFNVMLRDDKSFPFIVIRGGHEAPQLAKHRGTRGPNDQTFGPFASANAVGQALTTLQKAFLLRSCSDSVYSGRSRPCMLHQIKRCAAPCVGLVGPDAYGKLVDQAVDFLDGKSAALQKQLAAEMEQASANLDFETAARLRDRIRALAAISQTQGMHPQSFAEADVFAIARESDLGRGKADSENAAKKGGEAAVQVFFFRAGQNWGHRVYFPRNEADADEGEILQSFIAQFYENKPMPRLILTSHNADSEGLLADALSLKAGRKVKVETPIRGDKKTIIDNGVTNAREALGRRMAESNTQGKLLAGLAQLLEMNDIPERIEVYDNSHIQGTNAVGAMIVAGPDGFEKSQYRKWTIKSAQTNDDFAMMKEVLGRRFARLNVAAGDDDAEPMPALENAPESNQEILWPDLIIIDGGAAQLAVVHEAAKEAGVADDIKIISIAKGRDRDAGHEQIHQIDKPPFRLPRNDPVLYFLQRLRDESHRFVIGAHRQKRGNALVKSPLDGIEGLGPSRKKALLTRFGSARDVGRAQIEEIASVFGISLALAQRIYHHFNPQN